MLNRLKNPPFVARFLLKSLPVYDDFFAITEDFDAEYWEIKQDRGVISAKVWYWSQTLIAMNSYLNLTAYWSIAMIVNYLKTSLRNLRKHKALSIINISGLTLGITCTLLIGLYINYEMSFDRFHRDADRVFRVEMEFYASGQEVSTSFWTPPTIANYLSTEYPEIEEVLRILGTSGMVSFEDRSFIEERIYHAEENFFDLFSFPMVYGDGTTALVEPYSAVLTRETAAKYFGDEDPIGRTIEFQQNRVYTVTGVVEDIPENSHLKFDILFSFATLVELYGNSPGALDGWWHHSFITYIKTVTPDPSPDTRERIYNISKNHASDEEASTGYRQRFYIHPLTDIYLKSKVTRTKENTGDLGNLYILGVIAAFILTIAVINFINLTTAHASGRYREIAMRKVVGAMRKQLLYQHLTESTTIALIAMVISVAAVALLLPAFAEFTERDIMLPFDSALPYLLLTAFALILGAVSGFYPALVLSAKKPIDAFRGKQASSSVKRGMRQSLVIFQFIISVVLIAGTLVCTKQLLFMKNYDVGFDRESLIAVSIEASPDAVKKSVLMVREMKNLPGVQSAVASSSIPGEFVTSRVIRPEGVDENKNQTMYQLFVSPEFPETFGVEMVAGRFLSYEVQTDLKQAFVLNESAVKRFGWGDPENAIGKEFEYSGWKKGYVIGVIKDFNYASLHNEVFPLVYHAIQREFKFVVLRISEGDVGKTLPLIEEKWNELLPGIPFIYYSVNMNIDEQYRPDEKIQTLFGIFTTIAIVIACMGLIGLMSFIAEKRFREIGIRKVLGATTNNIVVMLSGEFLKLVLIGNAVALPASYLIMRNWLENYPYRIDSYLMLILFSGILLAVFTFATIGLQSVRAAGTNPVDTLRNE